jgi:hypothetical protein
LACQHVSMSAVVRWWCRGGTAVVRSGAAVVQWWYSGGAAVGSLCQSIGGVLILLPVAVSEV